LAGTTVVATGGGGRANGFTAAASQQAEQGNGQRETGAAEGGHGRGEM